MGKKHLTEEEKDKIRQWVKGGAPEGAGNPGTLPQISSLSRIGKPDTTVWFDSIFVEGINRDKFYIATLPIELGQQRPVRALEFVPNKNNLVHHMNGHLLNYEGHQKSSVFEGKRLMDIEVEEEQYLKDFDALKLYNDDGSKPQRIHSAVNYLPGVEATIYPEGIGGFVMKEKAILVANDLHFGPIPEGRWDHSHVNIFTVQGHPKGLYRKP